MKSHEHRFSANGRTLIVDPDSLLLFEETHWAAWPFNSRGRKQLNGGPHTAERRDLEGERKALNERLRSERNYLYLNVAHACNMRCQYCFAQGGAYGGAAQLMTPNLARAAVDWIFREGTGKHVTVNLFGGEPLLNISAVRAAIKHARKLAASLNKTFRAIISTNGTMDICQLADVFCSVPHRITVSVDGPPATHNLNRPFANGSPTYERIAANIERYVHLAGASRLAAKITWRRGQSDLVLMAKSVIGLGIQHMYIGRETSFSPQSSQPNNCGSFADFDELVAAYDGLAAWYVDRLNEGNPLVIQPLHAMLLAILQAQVTRLSCTAGLSTWCVSPKGEIYPCHRFVDNPKANFGNVTSVDVVEKPAKQLPFDGFVSGFVSPHCEGCWAKYWCFSDSCTYLTATARDFRLLDGFCRHMFHFLENSCAQIGRLSAVGRNTLRSAIRWPDGVPTRSIN